MIMEIYLNENKAKDNNIDIEYCYLKIDNFFNKGVVKVDKGVYFGAKKILRLLELLKGTCPDTNCFLKLLINGILVIGVDQIQEYRQDALESYYRLEEIHDDYVRNQKSS